MSMKRILSLITILAILPLTSYAEALFDKPVTVGWYAAPQVKLSTLNKEFAVLVGAETAILADATWGMGLAGYWLATNHELVSAKTDSAKCVSLFYGGLKLAHYGLPSYLIHPTFGLLIGMGQVRTPESYWTHASYRDQYHVKWRNDVVFALEPEVGVELNILEELHLNASVSYRILTGYESSRGFNSTDLSGITGTFTLKYGKMASDNNKK